MEAFRALVELRYLPAPLYLDCRGKIIEQFKAQYREVLLEQVPFNDYDQHVRMKNEQRGIQAFVNAIHVGLDMQFEPFDLDTFAREAHVFCRWIVRDTLKIETILRLGMRFFYRWPVPDRSLVDFTLGKLLGSGDGVSGLDVTSTHWHLRFQAADESYSYTFQFEPERAGEKGKEEYTGHIVADFDAFNSKLPGSTVTSLREDIRKAEELLQPMGTRLLEGITQHGRI